MFIIRCYILTALYFNPFSAKMKPLIKNRAVNSKRNSHAEFNFSAANQLILPALLQISLFCLRCCRSVYFLTALLQISLFSDCAAADQLILPERRFLITDLLSTVHAGCSKHRP